MTGAPKRILVATDFSRGSEEAFAAAVELARQTAATLEILHVMELVTEQFPFFFPYYDDRNGLITQIDRELMGLADHARQGGVTCWTKISEGQAATEIITRARHIGADFIVVGANGHRVATHALRGCVADRVRRLATCPVLTVPFARRAA